MSLAGIESRFRRAGGLRARIGALVLSILALPAAVSPIRLDDSLSQVFPPVAEWAWEPGSIRSGNSRLSMKVAVNVRLDTRRWVGSQARIFMVMPVEGAGPISAEWETLGRLLAGRLTPGERALVFSGSIPGPWLEDTMRVEIKADSRTMIESPKRLSFHFELETP